MGPAVRGIERAYPRLRISLSVPPHSFPTGVDWLELASRFERETVAVVASIPAGEGRWRGHVAGIPVHLWCHASRPPGVFLGQVIADDHEDRVALLIEALASKSAQLRPYHNAGLRTILLLDNDDIGSMEPRTWAAPFEEAVRRQPVPEIDEVYLVDSTERPPWFYPVKLGNRVDKGLLPDFELFFRKQSEYTS